METQSAAAILLKSFRLINSPAAHGHFLDLSVVFLLPLTFFLSSIFFPSLLDLLLLTLTDQFPNFQIFTSEPQQNQPPTITVKTIFAFLNFALFVLVSSLCGVGSITHSAFHGFHGCPLNFLSAVRSGISSLLPLLGTLLASLFVILLVLKTFALFLFMAFGGADLLGFPVDYSSPFFTGFVAVVVVALLMVLFYLQVLWTLAPVVVVLESTWGFDSLIRSARLVQGTRRIVVCLMLVFGSLSGVLGVCSWVLEMGMNEATGWKNWGLAVLFGVTTVFLMLLILHNAAAKTALYLHCKAAHGEEFADGCEYFHLLVDDGNC